MREGGDPKSFGFRPLFRSSQTETGSVPDDTPLLIALGLALVLLRRGKTLTPRVFLVLVAPLLSRASARVCAQFLVAVGVLMVAADGAACPNNRVPVRRPVEPFDRRKNLPVAPGEFDTSNPESQTDT